MMGIRKMLELIFTPIELKILDDALPEFRRKEKLDHEEALEQEASPKSTNFEGWIWIDCKVRLTVRWIHLKKSICLKV